MAVGVLFLASLAMAQDDPIPPGIRAGQEAYEQAEVQRRAAAGAQVELNQIMRSRVPWPSPYGDTIYYAPPAYNGGGYTPYGYSQTMHRPYGYHPSVYLGTTAAFGIGTYNAYPSLFAYSYVSPPIRQPIGQRQVQTGPRRWESYPIYGDEPEFAPAASAPAAPPVATRSVETPAPPRAVEPPPAPMEFKRRGPREF
jgi:hypothetical protein